MFFLIKEIMAWIYNEPVLKVFISICLHNMLLAKIFCKSKINYVLFLFMTHIQTKNDKTCTMNSKRNIYLQLLLTES